MYVAQEVFCVLNTYKHNCFLICKLLSLSKGQQDISKAKHQTETNHPENVLNHESIDPLNPVDTIQTQTDDNTDRTEQISENQVHVSGEQDADNIMKESNSENDSHSVVPPHNMLRHNMEVEKLSIDTETEFENNLSSVSIHEREEQKGPYSEPLAKEVQLHSPESDDRNLEQFSEVLLDSDSSASNHEAIGDELSIDKKDGKRVRFADEVGTVEANKGKSCHMSHLSTHAIIRMMLQMKTVESYCMGGQRLRLVYM